LGSVVGFGVRGVFNRRDIKMTQSNARKLIGVNLAFWGVATLVNPVLRLLPTSSGEPAKIFELLVPLFFIMLAGGSTYLLKAAIGETKAG